MTARTPQPTVEVNILHRGVGAFILIGLILVLLKGLLREQQFPAASVADVASAVALPVPDSGYPSTIKLDRNRKVLNSIKVPVKIGSNSRQLNTVKRASPAAITKPKVSASVRVASSNTGAKAKRQKKSTKPRNKKPIALAAGAKQASIKIKPGLSVAKLQTADKIVLRDARKQQVSRVKKSRKKTRNPPLRSSLTKFSKSSVRQAGWIVQIGLYSARANALRVKADLRKRGFPVVSMPMKTGKGVVTRLWVGPYEKRSLATRVRKKMTAIARYKDSFVASNPLFRK